MDELRRELNRTFYREGGTKKTQKIPNPSVFKPKTSSLKKPLSQKKITRVLGFSVPVFFLALWVQLGLHFNKTNFSGAKNTQALTSNFEKLALVRASIFQALLTERTLLSEALVRGRETQKTILETQSAQISQTLESLLQSSQTETSKQAFEKLKTSFDQWKTVNSEILNSLADGDIERADDIYFETSKKLHQDFDENFNSALAQGSVELSHAQNQLESSQRGFFILFNFAFGFVTLTSLIVTLLSRKILTTFEAFIAHVRGHSYAALKEGELFGSSAETLVKHLKLLRKTMNEMQENVLGEKGGERTPRENQSQTQKAA